MNLVRFCGLSSIYLPSLKKNFFRFSNSMSRQNINSNIFTLAIRDSSNLGICLNLKLLHIKSKYKYQLYFDFMCNKKKSKYEKIFSYLISTGIKSFCQFYKFVIFLKFKRYGDILVYYFSSFISGNFNIYVSMVYSQYNFMLLQSFNFYNRYIISSKKLSFFMKRQMNKKFSYFNISNRNGLSLRMYSTSKFKSSSKSKTSVVSQKYVENIIKDFVSENFHNDSLKLKKQKFLGSLKQNKLLKSSSLNSLGGLKSLLLKNNFISKSKNTNKLFQKYFTSVFFILILLIIMVLIF